MRSKERYADLVFACRDIYSKRSSTRRFRVRGNLPVTRQVEHGHLQITLENQALIFDWRESAKTSQ
jgi:hypothetical protein